MALTSPGELSPQALFTLDGLPESELFAGADYAWEALARLQDYLAGRLAAHRGSRRLGVVHPSATLEGDVVIEAGAVIGPQVSVIGPAWIGAGAELRHGAFVRGGCIIGRGCVVGHATEVKGSLLLAGAKAPHFNYVGDSILGRDVNLGAGTVLSNLRHAPGTVRVTHAGQTLDTGLRKFGAVLGDGTETGCNCVCSPGTIAGRGVWIYPNVLVRGVVPPRHIVKLRQDQDIAPRRGE